jgi:hypothetical protein
VQVVTVELIQALLDEHKELLAPSLGDVKRKSDAHYAGRMEFDLAAWVSRYLPEAKERNWNEGRKWILPMCPFNSEHDRGEACIVQLASGAVSAKCQHDSCNWDWSDLRGKYEPEYTDRRDRAANGNGRKMTDREPPPEVLYEDERYSAEIEAFASRDRDPSEPAVSPDRPLWLRGPELVQAILDRAADPWITLVLGGDDLARLRVGATVVVMGGSGSGKSSLTSCLLVEHAKNVGPAIALSIELPADELGARIVGIRCEASWEDALRGNVARPEMERALGIPRLFVLDRRRANLANLEKAIDAARAEFPNQPILIAIDYAQLLNSNEREVRQRVSDVFAQIDDVAREKRVVAIALSQMSRVNAQKARRGEALGAESADLGAEAAAIERFATLTMSIGLAADREDGSSAVELSLGKFRMGKGDRVIPMTYYGRSGLWRVAGEAKTAEVVREQRAAEKDKKVDQTLEAALLGVAIKATEPMSRNELKKQVAGNRTRMGTAIERLLQRGDLVEVLKKPKGAKSRDGWMVMHPDRARDAGISTVKSATATSNQEGLSL